MQVLSATDSFSFTFFFFRFEKLIVIFAVTSRYCMEAFLNFLIYYYLIPQCLLNIL